MINPKYKWVEAEYQHFLMEVCSQEILGSVYILDHSVTVKEFRAVNVIEDEKKRFLSLEKSKEWLEFSVLGFSLE